MTGALAHRDSAGGEETVSRGEVQVMHAGTGITHSEFNAALVKPRAFCKSGFSRIGMGTNLAITKARPAEQPGVFHQVVAPFDQAQDGQQPIHADARVSMASLNAEDTVEVAIADGRMHGYQ